MSCIVCSAGRYGVRERVDVAVLKGKRKMSCIVCSAGRYGIRERVGVAVREKGKCPVVYSVRQEGMG